MATTNCLPSLGRGKVSPIQQMFGKRPNLSFLRPFGCKTWMLKPKHLRGSKFDSVAWDGVVIGYSNNYSAYQVSAYLFPHSSLPDSNSVAAFPFQEEDLTLFQDEDTNVAMQDQVQEDPADNQENASQQEGNDINDAPVDKQTGNSLPKVRRRLILHPPCHPTLVNSSINTGNILRYPRRQPVSLLTHDIKPKNHF
ncbi:hypothetical protein PCASD_26043 [Puccinia coronata f. sp. avenae]|uniref:Uncharacterized protein n=1 Tax=Puccinia coronata f. sp. avenae TaxID=200324 RepID=A0A2N5TT87_9BASI|nr:hypothetical protein PCASD_26043 [Puccinia coronata f. sp. avenae]